MFIFIFFLYRRISVLYLICTLTFVAAVVPCIAITQCEIWFACIFLRILSVTYPYVILFICYADRHLVLNCTNNRIEIVHKLIECTIDTHSRK